CCPAAARAIWNDGASRLAPSSGVARRVLRCDHDVASPGARPSAARRAAVRPAIAGPGRALDSVGAEHRLLAVPLVWAGLERLGFAAPSHAFRAVDAAVAAAPGRLPPRRRSHATPQQLVARNRSPGGAFAPALVARSPLAAGSQRFQPRQLVRLSDAPIRL